MYEGQDISPRRRGMTPIVVTLTAGVPKRFPIEGDWVACITAAVADLTARFDNGEKVPLPAGLGFRRYYGEIELESATGGAFTVLVGFGSVHDGRANVAANLNVTTEPGNTLSQAGDVAVASGVATLLTAADATCLSVLISNASTNTTTFRIGNSTVDAASGILLEPGVTIEIATEAAVYAYQASGGAVTLNVLRNRRV